MRAPRKYDVVARYLWQEYKVAGQFSKSWDDVEEAMSAAFRLANVSPPPDVADALKANTPRGSWKALERVEIEPWFYHEIGRPGDVPSIFSTLATLREDNIRRAVAFYGETHTPAEKMRKPRRKRKQVTDGTGGPAQS